MANGDVAPDSIAQREEPFSGFDAQLCKARTLMGGTESMRRAGESYLPKFEGEDKKHYDFRKAISTLFNGFRKAVWDFTSRVFEEPVRLDEDVPQEFKDWSEDIDLEGRNLSNFANGVFEDGLQSGIEYILVDAPPKIEGETLRDARSDNKRPYLVHIKPETVIGWSTGRYKNRTMLDSFRFKENVEVHVDEFKKDLIEQIRVFDLVFVIPETPSDREVFVRSRLFRKDQQTGKWVQFGDDLMIELDFIPIVPCYLNRRDFFKGSPPLEDLADLNITHWQSQSDQRNILHFARVPILFAKGLPRSVELKISASTVNKSSSPEADLKYVEHRGEAIAAGQKDLEHLEFQMQTLGLQFIVNRRGLQTATGENRNEKKEVSRLASMAQGLEEALTLCMQIMGLYANLEFKGVLTVHKDFQAGAISQEVLTFLIQSVMSGKISKRTFWKQMLRYGLLTKDFDPEDEEAYIEAEMDLDSEAGITGDPVPAE